jgi:ADP-ribosylation factor-binding protein GGA
LWPIEQLARYADYHGSAREATHALLAHINSRNPNQSLLALNVLDHLVKNCGYAIHLQISTKEFLNELVRRFPERPPMVTGRVMGRILEVGWRICPLTERPLTV